MPRTLSSSVGEDEIAGVPVQPWQFAYREALSPYIFTRTLGVIGLYLGAQVIMCPLGTDLSWTRCVAYFALYATLVAPLCHAQYAATLYLARFGTPLCMTMAMAAHMFLAGATCTVVVYGVDSLVATNVRAYGLLPVYLFITLSIVLGSAVIHYLVSQRVGNESARGIPRDPEAKPAEPPDEGIADRPAAGREPAQPSSRFLDRLPREVGRDIICLKMNDHYVDVVTTLGRCAVLLRFADAIAELGDTGVRIHRSYWVACSHVKGWERRNQRPLLRLTGGETVPVSRTYLPEVRAALERHRTGADSTPRPAREHA